MSDRSFDERNVRATDELRPLVGTLSPEDFAALPDASVDAAPAAGRLRLLDRSIHRLEHVTQVRRGLGRAER